MLPAQPHDTQRCMGQTVCISYPGGGSTAYTTPAVRSCPGCVSGSRLALMYCLNFSLSLSFCLDCIQNTTRINFLCLWGNLHKMVPIYWLIRYACLGRGSYGHLGPGMRKDSAHTEQQLGFGCISPSDYRIFLILLNVFFSKEEQTNCWDLCVLGDVSWTEKNILHSHYLLIVISCQTLKDKLSVSVYNRLYKIIIFHSI